MESRLTTRRRIDGLFEVFSIKTENPVVYGKRFVSQKLNKIIIIVGLPMFRPNTYLNRVSYVSFAVLALLALTLAASTAAQDDSAPAPKFVAPRFTTTNTSEKTDATATSEAEPALSDPVEEDSSVSEETEQKNGVDAEESSEKAEDESQVLPVAESEDAPSVKEPYDVYKENGHYFVDWEKPDLALVFTGMTNGYIEPCGCAGMERMKGGLSRRHTFLNELRNEKGWDVATIDSGQITVGFGVQEELKFDMAMNAFNLMEYDAIGIGKGELRFPAYFLLTFTAPTSSTNQSLYTSANIGVYGFHPTYTLPYKVIERGGKRIGVASVVFNDDSIARRDENFLYAAPEKKLLELAPKMKAENCDKWVLIVHGTEQESVQLAKKFPIFDYVVTSDTPSEPPAELKTIDGGDQSIIEVGEKGKYAVVLGLYGDGTTRYQRVALDSRYESSPDVTLLMKDYQTILKNLITTKGFREGLGVNPAPSPQREALGKYVGSKKCRSCHEEAYRVWAKSRHATAWKSLKETANPPRDFDPECISCHVVGWDGLQHFPYVDGYASEKQTPELINVGCESCHGPGEKHMTVELGDNEAVQERIRSAMRLGDGVKKVCYQCHDGDNSPAFDFDLYYPMIEHSEEDEEE